MQGLWRAAILTVLIFSQLRARAQTGLVDPFAGAQQCDDETCPEAQEPVNQQTEDSFNQEPSHASRDFAERPEKYGDTGSANTPTRPDESSSKSGREAQIRRRSPTPTGKGFSSRPYYNEPEFLKFVYSTTGQRLHVFGQYLFLQRPSTFAPDNEVSVPADYVIGPGDELMIHAWGQIDFRKSLIVDRSGRIYLPKVGPIVIAGVMFRDAAKAIREPMTRVFRNFDVTVEMGQLRTIQILVAGRAWTPGVYTVSSLSTVLDALIFAGGPAYAGSMRKIEVLHENNKSEEFDLYDFLTRGDKSKDIHLQSHDVIYIPPVGPLVAVVGDVNAPAIYELKGPTTVGNLIQIAGGLGPTADRRRAALERIADHHQRTVEQLPLDENGLRRPLADGDVLHIFPISPEFENAVTLRGNVAQPGRYPWHQGMRVHDLIPSKVSLVTRDYWAKQNALGEEPFGWRRETSEPTNGRRPKNPPNNDMEKTTVPPEDQTAPAPITDISRNSSDINWDYAVVQRLDPNDLSSRLLPFDLGHALDDTASPDNLALEPGDVITIFSQNDLAVPIEKRTKLVQIEGEVNAPGVYRALPGETLRDLVMKAGGLTPRAYLYAAEFSRESTRMAQQQQLNRSIDEMDKELRSRAAALVSSGTAEDRDAAQQQIAAERGVLDKLRETKATGRIVLELKPSDRDIAALPGLLLEDGDRLLIPPTPATVAVVGAVYSPSSFIYRQGRTVRDYLAEAGGGTREADGGRLFVIRADGSVISNRGNHSLWTGGLESFRLTPGDTVVVPERIRTTSALRELRDWSQVFSQFALGAAAIRVIGP
jgi:protein involved in polysaccharide export with SLBB domain